MTPEFLGAKCDTCKRPHAKLWTNHSERLRFLIGEGWTITADHEQGRGSDLAEGQGAGLLGEPELVREMFYHILHNALKFAKVECRILVQCARVEGRTLVCIADNGRGISLHDAERVCEPFFQEPDVPQLFGGVGLGLTLAKQIAEIHGGWITVKGEPEKGVTVAVLV